MVEIGPTILEKIFKFCHRIFCYFSILSPWKWVGPFIWTDLNPLYQRMLCAMFGWNGPIGSKEDFKKNFNILSLFCYYLPFENGMALHLKNWNYVNHGMLCAKFGWNWPCGSGDFKIFSMHFCYFIIIFPWKRVWPFIWTNLNPLYQRMLCAKFAWNWTGYRRQVIGKAQLS